MQLFLFLFPLQHIERPALQKNKQVVVLRMAFRARKVVGTFEKRAPGLYVSMNETYSDSSVVMVVALIGKCASFRVMFFARVISRPRKCRLWPRL